MAGYKLTYFNFRGRAEPTRILFAAGGIPFVDDRMSEEEFGKLKEKDPDLTLPILETNDSNGKFKLNQSMAINRYLARVFGIQGETLQDQGIVEEVTDDLVDMKEAMFGTFLCKPEEKASAEEKFVKSLRKVCSRIEERIKANMQRGDGFVAGPKMTFADIFVYEAFESILSQNPEALDSFPGIKKCREKVSKVPTISAYLGKRAQSPY